jgi:hypothetical protein
MTLSTTAPAPACLAADYATRGAPTAPAVSHAGWFGARAAAFSIVVAVAAFAVAAGWGIGAAILAVVA